MEKTTPAESTTTEGRAHRARNRRRNRFLPQAIGLTGGVALAAVAFWFFEKQADRVVMGKADALDEKIMDLVQGVHNPAIDTVMRNATRLGEHAAIGAIAVIVALRMKHLGRKHDAWTVLINTGGAMALGTGLKAIFQRQRPQELARLVRLPRSHSFPSGHSLLSAATFPIAVHHLVQRRSTRVQLFAHSLSITLVLTVGLSRVYLGVHFPSDVLGGYAAGLGWLGLTSLTHSLIDNAPPLLPGDTQ